MAELDTLLDVALDVADLAGRTTLGHFRTGVRPDWKADATPVTVADREAETVIRDALARRTPTHGVVGEEFGEEAGSAPYRWWIDPIDGTKAFVRGVPLYATLVGLERDGVMVAGVASFPALGETLAAAQGRGARLNGRRAYVSDVADPAQSAVSTTDVGRFEELGRGAAWARVRGAYGYRAGWSDAYGYLLVASGRIEAMLDPAIAPWDVAPFAAILPEAGGWFGTWAGDATPHGADALAVNAAQRGTLLDLLAGER
jgi:myo-inositol-1(or 4)-monophosphatase